MRGAVRSSGNAWFDYVSQSLVEKEQALAEANSLHRKMQKHRLCFESFSVAHTTAMLIPNA